METVAIKRLRMNMLFKYFIMYLNKENTIFGRLEENNLQYQIYSSALDYCSLLNVKNCKE